MSDNHIIIKNPERAIEQSKMHPLVEAAVRGGSIDTQTMRELMDLQERWEKGQAKKSYDAAMILLKRDLPTFIEHDKKVDFRGKTGRVQYTHTTLAKAVTSIVPNLTQYGFSHSWTPSNDDKMVHVSCRLTHADGHSEECSLSSQPDLSGNKAHSQGVASTITRLQRYTFLSLMGIATADMHEIDQREPDEDAVDSEKNLQAVAWMGRQGIGVKEAVAHVQRDVDKWTTADLDNLREWVKEQRAPKDEPKNDS